MMKGWLLVLAVNVMCSVTPALAVSDSVVTPESPKVANAERYKPLAMTDHQSLGVLNFLAGNWVSMDPNDHFIENWALSANGYLIGFRQTDPPVEYDFFVFEPSKDVLGVALRMRRMALHMTDLGFDARILGHWSADTANRSKISFEDPHGKYAMTSSYDSPGPNLLDIEIETKVDGKSTHRTVHLKRVAAE